MTNQPKASDLVAEARRWADDCDRSFYSSPFEKDAATLIRRVADELDLCQRRKENVHLRLELEADALKQARAREAKLREALRAIYGHGESYEQSQIARQALSEETT